MKNRHGWKSDARKEHKRCKNMLKSINTTNTIIRYFNSLRDVDSITPKQFHTIVQMMKKFPKLFGCVYNSLGYDEVSELLEPVVRLYGNMLFNDPYAESLNNWELPHFYITENTFGKICRLYGLSFY